jgi:hypothetical protein
MPIRKEMRDKYPPNWKELRVEVRARAGDKCERCGVRNHAMGYRDHLGRFVEKDWEFINLWRLEGGKPLTIVCTVAHLNHRPEDNRLENLAFMCQKCHNGHDAKMRAAGRKERALEIPGQMKLRDT